MTDLKTAVANLKVGDRVRVDGWAQVIEPGTTNYEPGEAYPAYGIGDLEIHASHADMAWAYVIGPGKLKASIRLPQIIEVIPAKEEPKPGEWRNRCCEPGSHLTDECGKRVYRSTGWSKDERKNARRRPGTEWPYPVFSSYGREYRPVERRKPNSDRRKVTR